MSDEAASTIYQFSAVGGGLVLAYFFGLVVNAVEGYSSSKIQELAKDLDAKEQKWILRLDGSWLKIQYAAVLCRLASIALVFSPLIFFRNGCSDPILLAKLGLLTVLVFAIGYAVPRAVARRGEEGIFLRYAGSIYILSWILWPLVAIATVIDRVVGKVTGSKPGGSENLTEEEILDIVSDGEFEGVIEEQEKEMIENIISFNDVPVSEVMTVRSDMTVVGVDTPLTEAAELAVSAGHSRIPVYEGDRDNVVGILYVKDLLKFWNHSDAKQSPVSAIMRKPFFVPETKSIAELFTEFKKRQVHFAVVLDEYGGTAGVITIEDILEEIVGDIEDEYDPVRAPEISKTSDNVWMLDAKIEIEELNEELDINLPESDKYETLGGMVMNLLGHIPEPGEQVVLGRLCFTVVESDARTVKQLKLERLPEPSEDDAPYGDQYE